MQSGIRYEFGDFRLNPSECLLLRNGIRISVPNRVLTMLLVLVQRSGHLVEKSELINTVWDGAFVEEGNVAVIISILRKALGDDRNQLRYIETVSKKGYRFVAKVVCKEEDNGSGAWEIPTNDESLPTSKRPSHEEIVKRAYFLWEKRVRVHGNAEHDSLGADDLLLETITSRSWNSLVMLDRGSEAMKKNRFGAEQIIGILKQGEAGVKTAELCREHGISAATFYQWKQKFGGMDVSESQRLKALEDENRRLKLLVAELSLHGEALKGVIRKSGSAMSPVTGNNQWASSRRKRQVCSSI